MNSDQTGEEGRDQERKPVVIGHPAASDSDVAADRGVAAERAPSATESASTKRIRSWAQERIDRVVAAIPTNPMLIKPVEGPVDLTLRPPGSKSITNRALVCAALAEGTTVLRGVLFSDDTVAMIEGLKELAVSVRPYNDVSPSSDQEAAGPGYEASSEDPIGSQDSVTVVGVNGRQRRHFAYLDARLSGTTARFLAPVSALLTERTVLQGDPALRLRPMSDLVGAMRHLGAAVEGLDDRLPLNIDGTAMRGGRVVLAGDVSSQFLSALLLSAPALRDGVAVKLSTGLVSVPYVEMTIDVMRSFGAAVAISIPAPTDRTPDPAFSISVAGSGYRAPGEYLIEPDASAASYVFGAAAITQGRGRVIGLGRDSVQGDLRFVEVLEAMGMAVEWGPDWVEVRHVGPLQGVDVNMADFSDVAQTLAVVASTAESPTRVTGIGFIRGKETDRVAAVVNELNRIGISAVEDDDGFTINPGTPTAGSIQTYEDHRMAMSFALLGLRYRGIQIEDPRCVAKTYPGFWQDFGQV